MEAYMLVRHKVKDFSAWKQAYEAHFPKRVKAGLTEQYLFRGANDPNEVIVLFEAKNLARAKAFSESPDLRDTMVKAGVVDRPDIFFLTDQYSAMKAASGY